MKKWKEVRIKDIARIQMGLSPKGETYNIKGNGTPLLNGPTEFGDKYPNCTSYTTDSKRKCNLGDLIFCVRGSTTGRMNWADKVYSLGRGVCSIRGNNKALTLYVKYNLDLFLNALLNLAGGSTFPNLNRDDIEEFKILLNNNYDKIAAVLSAYDDLIENNNRRIAILEKMAEEIYREWFVRLRFPGHEQVKIVKGVPEGWEIKKLGDIVELAYGKALKETDRIEGIFPVYGSSGIIGYHNKSYLKGPGIIVGRKGNVGNVIWSDSDFYPIDTVYYVIKSNKSNISLEYLYYLLQQMNFINNDAAVPGLNREQAYSNKFYFPSLDLIVFFEKFIKPLFFEKSILKKQNNLLTTSRDRLLTRLMSGKMDVEHLDIRFPKSMVEDGSRTEAESSDRK